SRTCLRTALNEPLLALRSVLKASLGVANGANFRARRPQIRAVTPIFLTLSGHNDANKRGFLPEFGGLTGASAPTFHTKCLALRASLLALTIPPEESVPAI